MTEIKSVLLGNGISGEKIKDCYCLCNKKILDCRPLQAGPDRTSQNSNSALRVFDWFPKGLDAAADTNILTVAAAVSMVRITI